MAINKRHKFVLRFWRNFKDIDNPTPKEFFQNQPKVYFIALFFSVTIYALYYSFYGFNGFLTGLGIRFNSATVQSLY